LRKLTESAIIFNEDLKKALCYALAFLVISNKKAEVDHRALKFLRGL